MNLKQTRRKIFWFCIDRERERERITGGKTIFNFENLSSWPPFNTIKKINILWNKARTFRAFGVVHFDEDCPAQVNMQSVFSNDTEGKWTGAEAAAAGKKNKKKKRKIPGEKNTLYLVLFSIDSFAIRPQKKSFVLLILKPNDSIRETFFFAFSF